MFKIIGIILICDGAGSVGWYKSDFMSVNRTKATLGRTVFRLLRTALGICLIMIS